MAINGNLTDKCDDVLRKCYVSESAFEVLSAISVAFALIYNPPRTISFKIKSNEDEEEAMAICMEAVVSTTTIRRLLIIQYGWGNLDMPIHVAKISFFVKSLLL